MLHSYAPRRAALVLVLLGLSPVAALAQQNQVNPYFEFLQARRLEGEGNPDAALAALLRAAAADPRSAEIKAEIAALYFRKRPPARVEGEKFAREALAIDENNVEANRALGDMYARAVDDAIRARTTPPAQDVKNSILYLERAAAGMVAPDINLQYYLGQMYLRDNQPQKAVQAFVKVVAQSPGNAQARQLLAGAYAAAGDLKGAIGTLSELVDYAPQLAETLALYLEQDGQLKEAAAYTVALSQQPNNRQLKVRRIAALYQAKDYTQAARYAAEARKQHPDDVNFARLQARALFDGGDRNGGIAAAEAAVKAFPKDAQTQFVLVDMYSDAGRPGDAEKLLRQMLSNEPSNPTVQTHLAYLLANRGEQLDEAVTLVKKALEARPDQPEFLDSLGWAYYKRGELNDAVRYLAQAAAKLPENSEVQDHLGDAHAKRGAMQDAINAWTKALAGDGQGIQKTDVEKKIADAKVKIQNAK
jgi:tetratricopeptide (TPR) repeat protein